MHHGAGPGRIAFVAVARVGIIGRFDTLGSRRQFAARLETHTPLGGCPRGRQLTRRPLVVALPRPPQTLQHWQLPDRLGRLGRLHGVQEVEAIFPHHLGIGLPVHLVSGQPHVLDALAIALVPRQGGAPLQEA
jgi:hypothetical protein